jgi:acyl-coenzyme A thioesterase PaaI-like protein
MSIAEYQALLDRTPFVQPYGFKVDSAADSSCTIRCPANKHFLRPDTIVSGPTFMTAADVAMWLAIVSTLGRDARSALTLEMKTNFVSALIGPAEFLCTATVLKPGSRVVFGVAECRSTDGRLLTHHTMTYVRRDSR